MPRLRRCWDRGSVARPRSPAKSLVPTRISLTWIVYVALLDDGSQVALSPDEFVARFGWQNDPNQAYLLGPTP